MKFNKNSYGKSLLDKIMTTIKPKLFNIEITNDNNNNKIVLTDYDNTKTNITSNFLNRKQYLKNTIHSGIANTDSIGINDDVSWNNLTKDIANNHNSYKCYVRTGGGSSEFTNAIMRTKRNLLYRAQVDVRGNINGKADPDDKLVSYYFGQVSSNGDNYYYNRTKRVYDGHTIYPQNLYPIRNNNGEPYKYILTREFKQGDEYFYFRTDDINNWYIRLDSNGNQYYYIHSFKFHRPMPNGEFSYVQRDGKICSNLGYSDDILFYNLSIDQDTTKDANDPLRYFVPTGNTVEGQTEYRGKLKNKDWNGYMWRGKYNYYPVGTVMLQAIGGGTFQYWILNRNIPLDNKTYTHTGRWLNSSSVDGITNHYIIRDGTDYVRGMFLLPYYLKSSNGNYIHYVRDDDNVNLTVSNIRLEYKYE